MKRIEIVGGKVQLYRRSGSPNWQCSASIENKQYRTSTKQDSLEHAKLAAEDWYLDPT